MSSALRVVTCAGGAPWEAPLVRGLQRRELGVELLRRCVDHGELLGVALRDRPRAAIVAAEMPWLDRDLVATLHQHGVTVVAIDGAAIRPLERIGVAHRLEAGATADQVAALLHGLGSGDDARAVQPSAGPPSGGRGGGRLVAVWGAPGSPGRTSVAVQLALEASHRGIGVTLVDGDTWSATIAQLLDLAEAPSVAQAARLAAQGWPQALGTCLQTGPFGCGVLVGLAHPELWPEVRELAWRAVLDAARAESELVVVDLAASIEEDEELAFDRAPYRRNLMTLGALEVASDVLLVAGADPVAARRAIVAHRALTTGRPAVAERVTLVVNRAPASAHRLQECSRLFEEWTGSAPRAFLPVEPAFERAVWEGRGPLRSVTRRSRWLRELAPLLGELVA